MRRSRMRRWCGNFYLGADPESQGANPTAPVWRTASFQIRGDVTAGQTYTLRFAVVDNNGAPLDVGVDNVSVVAQNTPEAGSVWLLLLGGAVCAGIRRARR